MASLQDIIDLLKKDAHARKVEQLAIDELESERGIILPDTLKSLLLDCGECAWGGEIDGEEVLCYAHVVTGGGSENVELSGGWDLKSMKQGCATPDTLVPLFGDGGGNFICLDYSEVKENPPLCFYDHDYDKIIPGAASFDAFIDSLDID